MDEIKPIQNEEEERNHVLDSILYSQRPILIYRPEPTEVSVTIPRQWVEQVIALLDVHGKGTKQQVKEILKGWIK
jgi:hypothetical protein